MPYSAEYRRFVTVTTQEITICRYELVFPFVSRCCTAARLVWQRVDGCVPAYIYGKFYKLLRGFENTALLTAAAVSEHRNTPVSWLKAVLAVLCFYSKQVFGPTANSQPIGIKFCTHLLLYGIHLWADLDRDRCVGGSRPNQNDCFVILVNASYVLYIDPGLPRFRLQSVKLEVRTGAIVKNSGIL